MHTHSTQLSKNTKNPVNKDLGSPAISLIIMGVGAHQIEVFDLSKMAPSLENKTPKQIP